MRPARITVLMLLTLAACQRLAIGAADRSSLVAATQVEVCPLGVPEAQIRGVETLEGVDVHFSAPPDRRGELRRRVRGQARANGPERHRGEGHNGEHHGPRDHGLRLWSLGRVTTHVEDTPSGAKLSIAPVHPAEIDEVRARILRRAEALGKAACVH